MRAGIMAKRPVLRPLWAVALLAGCASPGPSVPEQEGKNLAAARAAVQSCARFAPDAGQNALVTSYVAGFLFGGILLGPIVVASTADSIRESGEASGVDACLAEMGFRRRDLTTAEIAALEAADRPERRAILDHLIGGGSLETFNTATG